MTAKTDYDKDQAQLAMVARPATYRAYPTVCLSLFESTGEVLVTYGDEHDGYFTGPYGAEAGPVSDLTEARARLLAIARALPRKDRYYEHFKGGKYIVLAVSLHERTGEALVTYRSILKATNWTRTLVDFTSFVPRFKELEAGG